MKYTGQKVGRRLSWPSVADQLSSSVMLGAYRSPSLSVGSFFFRAVLNREPSVERWDVVSGEWTHPLRTSHSPLLH